MRQNSNSHDDAANRKRIEYGGRDVLSAAADINARARIIKNAVLAVFAWAVRGRARGAVRLIILLLL